MNEKFKDWQTKFERHNIKCSMWTGESENDANELTILQKSQIICSTPEKWLTLSRKYLLFDEIKSLSEVYLKVLVVKINGSLFTFRFNLWKSFDKKETI